MKNKKLIIIKGKLLGKEFVFNPKDSSSVIIVTFNPTEYSVSKSNKFSEIEIPGLGSPIIQFNQGASKTLDVELMLDTYTNGIPIKNDIRIQYIYHLNKLLAVDSHLHAPPPCQVLWGSLVFMGVLEKMDVSYIMFTNDGIPVRAKVKLSFKEFVPLKLQIKGSPLFSPDRRRLFTMKQGDSIWLMAYKAYSSAGLWRVIADANKIDDPLKIENGKDLIIPVLKQ